MKDYTIEEHIHRFGVWTAARAASKSLLSNVEIEDIIDRINLKEAVELKRATSSVDTNSYEYWLKRQCDHLIAAVNSSACDSLKKVRISYGLAAKIISIYIKTVEVIPTKGTSKLSEIAFPPIDSILLKNINKKYNKGLNIRWSKFDWETYIQTINHLKVILQGQPMWRLESEWYNPKKECNTQTTANH